MQKHVEVAKPAKVTKRPKASPEVIQFAASFRDLFASVKIKEQQPKTSEEVGKMVKDVISGKEKPIPEPPPEKEKKQVKTTKSKQEPAKKPKSAMKKVIRKKGS